MAIKFMQNQILVKSHKNFYTFLISLFCAAVLLCCNLADNGKDKVVINVDADSSLTKFSKTQVLMIDDVTKDTTVLFDGKLNSLSQLKNIAAPNYRGQKVKIIIRGFYDDILSYEEDRDFDGQNNKITDKKIVIDTIKITPPIDKPLNKKPYFLNNSGKQELDISIKDTVTFIDSALDEDGNIKDFAFDFNGDGKFDSSISMTANKVKVNALHVYNDSGKYKAIMRVTDDSGALAYDTIEILVEKDVPKVDPGPKIVKRPGIVDLSGSYTQKFGKIVMFKWDFDGDGKYDDSSATTALMSHNYVNENTYLARFYVRDDDGNEATGTREVVISATQKIVNTLPSISGFTHVFLKSIKDTVNLNVTASDEDGKVMQYSWDYNHDGKADTTITTNAKVVSISFSKVYPDSGSFKLILNVKDDSGAVVSDTSIVNVLLDAPKANAGNDTTVITGTAIWLHAEGSDQMGKVVKREWKIGDGAFIPVSKDDTTLMAGVVGKLTCTLRITDDDGNQTLDDKVITINVPAANVLPQITNISINKDTCTIGDTLTITAHGKDTDGKVLQYLLDYEGDGKYDDSAYVNLADIDILMKHRYVKTGFFTTSVKIKDDQGGLAEKSYSVNVKSALPTPNPGQDTTVYAGTSIKLHAKGFDRYNNTVKLEWKGPDGIYRLVGASDTTVAAPQMATVSVYYLRATDIFGQTSEKSINVTVIMASVSVHVILDGKDSVFDAIPLAVGGKVTYMIDTTKLKSYSFQKWVVISGSVDISDTNSRKTDITLNANAAVIKANMISKKILVISATGGFSHGAAIAAARTMISQLGLDHNFAIDFSDSTRNLPPGYFAKYQTVVFNQVTHAGSIFDDFSKLVFEAYYQAGGGYVGMHGSSDLGATWDNYADILGAVFASHKGSLGNLLLDTEASGQAVAQGLPSSYNNLDEEWYNLDKNPRGSSGTKMLFTVRNDSLLGGSTVEHPVSWIRNYKGGRMFYTSMGHSAAPFKLPFIINHFYQGIVWSANWK